VRAFDRRELLQLGVTGLLTSQLLGARSWAQANGTPPRRVILFEAPEGVNWRFWLSKSMNEGANAGKSGEKPLSGLLSDTFFPNSNLWKVFGETYGGAGRESFSNLIGDVNVIDGVCNAAGRGDEGGIDSHHRGMMGFKAGVDAKDDQRKCVFGGWNVTIEHLIANAWFAGGKPASVIDNVLNLKLLNAGYHGKEGPDYRGWLGLGGPSADVLVSDSSPNGLLEPGRLWDKLFNGFMPGGSSGPSPASVALKKRFERMKRRNAVTAEEVAQAKRLLGADEAKTLDSYLAAVQGAERRIADQVTLGEMPMPSQCQVPTKPTATFQKSQFREYSKTIADQIALAMACDRVRMVNLLNWATNPQGVTIHPATGGDWHTDVGHTDANAGDKFFKNRFELHCEVFRAFLELVASLKRVKEGNGTLLDSTTILVMSEHSGEHHKCMLPHFALMAGGGGVKADGSRVYRTGRYIKLNGAKNNDSFSNLRTANDLCLTLAHGAGVTQAKNNSNAVAELTTFGHPDFTKGPIEIAK
jgi:Protein of unknown function (DUF1552)